MPKVKFLKNIKGSPDGIKIIQYKEGEVCDIVESLYSALKNSNVFEDVHITKENIVEENKAFNIPLENKDIQEQKKGRKKSQNKENKNAE